MASSLSILLIILLRGVYKIECKNEHNNKKCKTFGSKYKDRKCCIGCTNVQNYLRLYKCLCFKRNY